MAGDRAAARRHGGARASRSRRGCRSTPSSSTRRWLEPRVLTQALRSSRRGRARAARTAGSRAPRRPPRSCPATRCRSTTGRARRGRGRAPLRRPRRRAPPRPRRRRRAAPRGERRRGHATSSRGTSTTRTSATSSAASARSRRASSPRTCAGRRTSCRTRRSSAARARRGTAARSRSASRAGSTRASTATTTSIGRARRSRPSCPDLHVHAFSALEVWQGAATLGVPLDDYLARLRDAGPRVAPGHGRRDPRRRGARRPLPGQGERPSSGSRCTRRRTASGLRSTATIMFGHVDAPRLVGAPPAPRPRAAAGRRAGSPSSCRCRSCTWRRRST